MPKVPNQDDPEYRQELIIAVQNAVSKATRKYPQINKEDIFQIVFLRAWKLALDPFTDKGLINNVAHGKVVDSIRTDSRHSKLKKDLEILTDGFVASTLSEVEKKDYIEHLSSRIFLAFIEMDIWCIYLIFQSYYDNSVTMNEIFNEWEKKKFYRCQSQLFASVSDDANINSYLKYLMPDVVAKIPKPEKPV